MSRPETVEKTFPLTVGFNWNLLLMTLLLLLVAFLVLTPLGLMVFNSFQIARPGEPVVYGLDGWRKAFTSPGILAAMGNTFALAIPRKGLLHLLRGILGWITYPPGIPIQQ